MLESHSAIATIRKKASGPSQTARPDCGLLLSDDWMLGLPNAHFDAFRLDFLALVQRHL